MKQELYFPLLIAIHFVFWAIDLAMYDGTYEFTSKHVVGEMFSSWVVTVLSANLLMATRAGWVERLFGGLDKMYLVHRRSAVIAVVLLVLHFIVVPRDPSFTAGKPMGFAALLLILGGVIVAAAPVFKRKIPYNKWVLTHKMLGAAYLLGVAHSFFVPTLTSELPIVRVYVYSMALIGALAWIYKSFLHGFIHRIVGYTVTDLTPLEDDVLQITMKPTGKHLQYEAGQFAFVGFHGHSHSERHPFTLSSHPSDPHLQISVKALGDYTAKLQTTLKVGTVADVVGPYGRFDFKVARHSKQLWLAGGIGVTPFLPFSREISGDREATLIWSVRQRSDRAHLQQLTKTDAQNGQFNFILHDVGELGHFSIAQRYAAKDLVDTSVFICGPEVMREAYISQLMEKGVAIQDIHYEEFSFR